MPSCGNCGKIDGQFKIKGSEKCGHKLEILLLCLCGWFLNYFSPPPFGPFHSQIEINIHRKNFKTWDRKQWNSLNFIDYWTVVQKLSLSNIHINQGWWYMVLTEKKYMAFEKRDIKGNPNQKKDKLFANFFLIFCTDFNLFLRLRPDFQAFFAPQA